MRVPYLSKPTETQHTNQRKQASNQRKQALPLPPARIGGTVRLNGLASQGGWRPSFRTTDTQEAEGTPPRGSSIRRALDGARRFEGRVLSKFRRAVLDHPEGGDVLNHPEKKKQQQQQNKHKKTRKQGFGGPFGFLLDHQRQHPQHPQHHLSQFVVVTASPRKQQVHF